MLLAINCRSYVLFTCRSNKYKVLQKIYNLKISEISSVIIAAKTQYN